MKNVIDITPYLTPVYIRPARRKRRFGSIAAFVESVVTLLVGAMSVLVLLALLVAGGVALVVISMALTFIAGLIPSGIAARKDPVEALRTE